MDGDPTVENGLDSFSLSFPLPYRVSFIILLGIWGWAINLHYLASLHIDVPALIRYPPRPSSRHPSHHVSVYRLAALLSAVYALSILTFWAFTHRDPTLVQSYGFMPLLYLLILALVFVLPLPRRAALPQAGRSRLRSTLRRVALGGIAEARDGKFGDILLADVLTSYAKVLGDLYVVVCMALRSTGSANAQPDRGCGGVAIVPLILAAPSLIRLRQCLIEHGRVRRMRSPSPSSSAPAPAASVHLANALKYSTAFPVIILSALMRNRPDTTGVYYRLWVAACAINSLYSFYWDVARDWDLTLFDGGRNPKPRTANPESTPFGLRRTLRLGSPTAYYGVVALDLVLRCTWSLKLSPHLDHVADFESSIFVVELLEVVRRWVWMFLRIETEWIRNQSAEMPLSLVGREDILLRDFGGKYEDEED